MKGSFIENITIQGKIFPVENDSRQELGGKIHTLAKTKNKYKFRFYLYKRLMNTFKLEIEISKISGKKLTTHSRNDIYAKFKIVTPEDEGE